MSSKEYVSPRRGRALELCLLLFLLSPISSCRKQAAEPSEARVLRIGFGIGPTAKASGVNVLTGMLTSESLLAHDWQGRPVPALAESWEWEDQRTSLLLHLKPGVRLHDGSLLTAETVAKFLQQSKSDGSLGFRYVTTIEPVDPSTLRIRLSRPDFFLLAELSEIRLTHPDAPDIATGPFKLVGRTPVVEARRFDTYHGGTAALGAVKIITYDTQRAAWAALMRGEVDVVQEVTRESVQFMERSSSIKTYSAVQPFYLYLAFNVNHPALRRVEVRRAMSEALDRQDILKRAMQGHGRVAEAPIWPFHWAYTPPAQKSGFNPELAAEMLDQAGFRIPAAKGAGERRARFSFTCLVYSEDPQYERIALMVQRQLFDVGIDMKIELLPLKEFLPRAGAGKFDAFLMRANASRALDFTYRFWRSSGAANTAPQNTGYTGADDALDALRHATSDEQTRAALAVLARRFHDDAPAAFIAWTEVTRAIDVRFSVGESTTQDPFTNIWQWQPAPPGPDK